MSDNDFQMYPSPLSEDEVQEIKEEPKKKSKPVSTTTSVTWFRETQGYCLCVDDEGNGYKIPAQHCATNSGTRFDIDLTIEGIEVLYNWEKELKAVLPDTKTLIKNANVALWSNGAISKAAARENAVQKNLMRGAFPYRIVVEDDE